MKKLIVASALMIFLSACSREEPTTYEVPKGEQPAAPMTQGMRMGGADTDNAAVMQAHASMMETMKQSTFKADLPEGWTEKGGSGMRMASYAIDGTSIDFYLISLSVGDVPSNVNRWRGQVDLPNATPEEIAQELQSFDVDRHPVNYIEIYNEEGGNGIVAAIIDLSPSYWYFTAKGPVDELKAHASDLRKFIESIQFEGHSH